MNKIIEKIKQFFNKLKALFAMLVAFFAVLLGQKMGIDAPVASDVDSVAQDSVTVVIPSPVELVSDKILDVISEASRGQRFYHKHMGFEVCYLGEMGIPEYVTYILTAEEAKGSEARSQRTDDFRQCPQIKGDAKISATHNDYTKSGYDRGHLCPNNDRDFSQETASETFHMCNVTPQTHEINAGVWKQTEDAGHKYAKANGEITICCGVIFDGEVKTFTNPNKNKIAIPDAFFKIFVKGDEVIDAYIIPNKSTGLKKGLNTYKTNLEEIEKRSHLKFKGIH